MVDANDIAAICLSSIIRLDIIYSIIYFTTIIEKGNAMKSTVKQAIS